jgi:hypothetical protein
MSEPRPIKIMPDKGVEYFAYDCSACGEEGRNTFSEPYRTDMLKHRLCWTCNYWREFEEQRFPKRFYMTIIEGHVYSPGNRTSGEFRGMAGRRFDIEYIEPSVHAGKRITTFDLWSGSVLPESLREKFPDTAVFLDASKEQVGETTCWNPTQTRAEPYPLPSTLSGRGTAS